MHHDIAARPSLPLESLPERGDLRLCLRVILDIPHQDADPPHPLGLLRARREWPRRRATEQRYELAASYCRITIAGRKIELGYFATELEAAHAYDAAASEHFGAFARLNKLPESD
jgi:hypothetical protein